MRTGSENAHWETSRCHDCIFFVARCLFSSLVHTSQHTAVIKVIFILEITMRLLFSASIAIAVFSLAFPYFEKWRDDSFYVPLHRSKQELQALGACSGNVTVEHSAETLKRLQATTPDGRVPVGKVTLSYISTLCNDNGGGDKEHVVLIHPTGVSSLYFTRNYLGEDPLWTLLQNAGYDITAVDLRGHGQSEVTEGPYSIELLGADVAALVREKFPNSKVHCHGVSAGLGTCMAFTAYDSDIVKTLTGSGFLFDRSGPGVAAYVFSRLIVIRLLGLAVLSVMSELAMKVAQPGVFYDLIRHTRPEGFAALSSGWLAFNITRELPQWTTPTLIMVPEFDEALGHTRALTDGEINMMPDGLGSVISFPGYSHVMLFEKGGPAKSFKVVDDFMKKAVAA